MTEQLGQAVKDAVKELFDVECELTLTRPDEQFGDYATNAALQLSKQLGKNPREIAEAVASKLSGNNLVQSVSVAGPGFINIKVSDETLFSQAINAHKIDQSLRGKSIVAEYSDPNPFKVLHAGHLYTSLVGDAIANIIETAGADVHRVNFGGDVGLHVAKTMWAIVKELGGENPDKLTGIADDQKLDWISTRYVAGNEAYETDEAAKSEIIECNKRIYKIHEENNESSPFAQIYWTCRQWSYDGFDALYTRLGMQQFEKYYPESATTQLGVDSIKSGLEQGFFHKSDGAVVFDEATSGLHTRVFMNSEGLPTYEAKDLGLALTKWQDYQFDKSLIITGDDIQEYMKVIIAAVQRLNPEAAQRTTHLTHGQIKLAGGQKMSSRLGNILRADDILDAAFSAHKEVTGKDDESVVLGAVRYSFLRNRIGGDIIYDPKESVSLEGNSGPYLQYALVRARSILRKAGDVPINSEYNGELEPAERSLARQISLYHEVFAKSLNEYAPHNICTYLYELAVIFNRFYEQSRVLDDPRSELRLQLVTAYEHVLSHGLGVLGMPKPQEM
jgi:arginyl-tRNA synthetase